MKKSKYIAYIISISFILTAFFGAVHFCCFDERFYTDQHNKIMLFGKHINEHIGISNDDLEELTTFTLDFLNNPDASLDKQMNIKGELREVYTIDEKAHMVDVRKLNLAANKLLEIFAVILFTSVLYYILAIKNWKQLNLIYKKTLKVFIIAFAFIAIWVFIDFDSFWTLFHKIFFVGNDLWLLNLQRDILIMIVPPEFFNNLVIRIIAMFIVTLLLFGFILYLLSTRKVKND